ncbi:MAG: hypothetical protein ACK5PG_05920 [Lysobacterales bacterium]|jgi:hypothetical protein
MPGAVPDRKGSEMVNAAKGKVENLGTEQLKEMAAQLYSNMEDAAGDVLGWVLSALESRVGEPEFLAFCESLA